MFKNCSFADCCYAHYAHGLCLAHYRQRRAGRALAPVKRRTRYTACTFANCTRPPRGSGLCGAHFRQRQRGELLRPVVEPHRGTTGAPRARSVVATIPYSPGVGAPATTASTASDGR